MPASSRTGSTTTSAAIFSGPTASQPSTIASVTAATAASASVDSVRPKPCPITTRRPAAAASSTMASVRSRPPCFMTFTLTRSAASRRMISTSEAGPVTLSSAMSGMPMPRRISASPAISVRGMGCSTSVRS